MVFIRTKSRSPTGAGTLFRGQPCSVEFPHNLGSKQTFLEAYDFLHGHQLRRGRSASFSAIARQLSRSVSVAAKALRS